MEEILETSFQIFNNINMQTETGEKRLGNVRETQKF